MKKEWRGRKELVRFEDALAHRKLKVCLLLAVESRGWMGVGGGISIRLRQMLW